MDDSEFGVDDAYQVFLDAFADKKDAPGPSEGAEEKEPKREDAKVDDTEDETTKANEDETEGDEQSTEGDEDEGQEDNKDDKPKRKYADDSDDTYVKVKVGDEETEVPVKDLKRLWGQESALTKRSQEVAKVRETAEAEQAKAGTVLQKMLERAKAQYEPYSKIDWFALAQQGVTQEQAAVLREQAQQAQEAVKFIETEVTEHMRGIAAKQHEALRTQAKTTWDALSDPVTGIKDWNQKTYDSIREYAVAEGMHAELVNTIVDEKVIRLMHKAYLYDQAQKAITTPKPTPKDKGKGKKIVKSSSTPRANGHQTSTVKKAEARQRELGNIDSTADAFLARFTAASDDE